MLFPDVGELSAYSRHYIQEDELFTTTAVRATRQRTWRLKECQSFNEIWAKQLE
jgi:hypothetical protein